MNEMRLLEDMCAAVPPPDPQRLAKTRARVLSAITEGGAPASRGPRGPWLSPFSVPRRRWLGWVAPLAAAAAVAGVIIGTQGVFGAIHIPPVTGRGHSQAATAAGQSPGPVPGAAHPITAYVASESGTVTPILTATNKALHVINGGANPSAFAFTPDSGTAYVLNDALFGTGSVIPIRTATNKALKPITVGQDPRAFAMTPDGETLYVTNYQSGTVIPIRTATNTALHPINAGSHPWAIAITPDGKTAYVANAAPPRPAPVPGGVPTPRGGSALRYGTVTPIRTATNTALAPIKVGLSPRSIVITPDGATAYVLCNSEVVPIQTATNTALAPIKVPLGSFEIAITPNGATVYVLDLGSSQDREGLVIPIRTATNTALAPIPIGKAWPGSMAIAFTPDSKTAYVADAKTDTVTPIRTVTNTALAPITVGLGPVAVAVTPDGKTAYVANFATAPHQPGTVTPIRTATNTALAPIKVGQLPRAIGITP